MKSRVMAKSTIVILFLVCIIILLSSFIFLSNSICKWQADFSPSAVSMDLPAKISKVVIIENVTSKQESTTAAPSLERGTYQGFVISSRQSRFKTFLHRNRDSLPASQNLSLTWFPASNGRDQTVLDEFAYLTGFPPVKADSQSDGYDSPHHTGCFMSHWNIYRIVKAGWQTLQSLPKALFVLEDDCICAKGVMEEITKTLPLLPPDWDILFVGAKPFSYYYPDPLRRELKKRNLLSNFSHAEFEQLLCEGQFGRTPTGPFAPDGGRNLSLDLPYWRIKYITNTQSYLVNPARLDRILHLLEHPPRRHQEPIDIMLAEAGRSGGLNLFMTTMEYCFQIPMDHDRQVDRPRIWEGFYHVEGMNDYRWGTMLHSKCPSKP